jgi:sigma-E factor negative regulatory protein RseC
MSQTEKTGIISHEGTVQKVDGNSVTVIISTPASCSGCQAEGTCSITGSKEKAIDINGSYNVSPGDHVTVQMRSSMGYKALFLGYIVPGIVVVSSLIVLISLKISELISGIISLAITVLYYFLLYFFRNKINNKFIFILKEKQ